MSTTFATKQAPRPSPADICEPVQDNFCGAKDKHRDLGEGQRTWRTNTLIHTSTLLTAMRRLYISIIINPAVTLQERLWGHQR